MIKQFGESINTILFSNKEDYFIVAGYMESIHKLAFAKDKQIVELQKTRNEEDVHCLLLDQTEEYLYLAGTQKRIVQIDNQRFELASKFPKKHQGTIYSLVLMKNTNQLVSAGSDGNIILWSVEKKMMLKTIFQNSQFQLNAMKLDSLDAFLYMASL